MTTITFEVLRDTLLAHKATHGVAATRQLMLEHSGTTVLGCIDESDYPAVLAAAREEL